MISVKETLLSRVEGSTLPIADRDEYLTIKKSRTDRPERPGRYNPPLGSWSAVLSGVVRIRRGPYGPKDVPRGWLDGRFGKLCL
jgi:hypothetical protein